MILVERTEFTSDIPKLIRRKRKEERRGPEIIAIIHHQHLCQAALLLYHYDHYLFIFIGSLKYWPMSIFQDT